MALAEIALEKTFLTRIQTAQRERCLLRYKENAQYPTDKPKTRKTVRKLYTENRVVTSKCLFALLENCRSASYTFAELVKKTVLKLHRERFGAAGSVQLASIKN
jgi:hypothetical protein